MTLEIRSSCITKFLFPERSTCTSFSKKHAILFKGNDVHRLKNDEKVDAQDAAYSLSPQRFEEMPENKG